MTKTPTKIV